MARLIMQDMHIWTKELTRWLTTTYFCAKEPAQEVANLITRSARGWPWKRERDRNSICDSIGCVGKEHHIILFMQGHDGISTDVSGWMDLAADLYDFWITLGICQHRSRMFASHLTGWLDGPREEFGHAFFDLQSLRDTHLEGTSNILNSVLALSAGMRDLFRKCVTPTNVSRLARLYRRSRCSLCAFRLNS